jgi:hypothetical protein
VTRRRGIALMGVPAAPRPRRKKQPVAAVVSIETGILRASLDSVAAQMREYVDQVIWAEVSQGFRKGGRR